MKSLGATLVEPENWSCCGSTPAHAVDHLLAAALAARNLAIVERMDAHTDDPVPLLPFRVQEGPGDDGKERGVRKTR